jgi:Integrase zinc binding domain
MLSRYPTVPIATSDFEEVTTLQDFSFPATSSNIKQSKDSIPDLTSKLSTSSLYTTIRRDGFDLITRNRDLGPALFADILAWYHTNLNHPGQDCTYNTIHATFYTPNMEAKVRKYVHFPLESNDIKDLF